MPRPSPRGKGKGKGKFAKGKDGKNPNRGLFRRRKFCRFTAEKIKEVDYKDIAILKDFVNENGKIIRSEEHTSEVQSRQYLVCRLLLEKKKRIRIKCTEWKQPRQLPVQKHGNQEY